MSWARRMRRSDAEVLLEQHDDALERLIEWALEAGADPEAVAPHLDEHTRQILWSSAVACDHEGGA